MKKKNILFCCRENEKYSNRISKYLISKTNLKIFKSKTYYEKLPKKFYKFDYDYIINFRSYLILDKKILNRSKIAINFHPSLPKYRGVGCANYAIMNNDRHFGSTIHLIGKKIDSGRIINVKKFKVSKNITLDNMLKKTHKSMYYQAITFIKNLLDGNVNINKEISKNKFKWSKKYNSLKKLNKFYDLKINIDKKMFKKYLRSTIVGNFRPTVSIHEEKFLHVPVKNRK